MSLSIYEIDLSDLSIPEREAVIDRIDKQAFTGAQHYADNIFHIRFELERSDYLELLRLPDNCHLKLIHQGDR